MVLLKIVSFCLWKMIIEMARNWMKVTIVWRRNVIRKREYKRERTSERTRERESKEK